MVCEAFGIAPSEALREMENDVGGLVMTIITMRAFARAKELSDNAKSQADLPDSGMIDLVQEIEFAAVKKKMGGASS